MALRSLVVATANLHAGIDGYGRPFDVVAAVLSLGADLVALQEVFAPAGRPSQAAEIAAAGGYEAIEVPLSPAWRISAPLPAPDDGSWEPRRPYPREARALRVGSYVRRSPGGTAGYDEGTWGIALLSRTAPVATRTVELGRLRRDFTRRAAIVAELPDGFVAVATHLAHSTHGSPLQLARLRRELPPAETPGVLAGDMNFWGPPIAAVLPGWRRAATGRTWPRWRPAHQLDHLFVTRAVGCSDGEVHRSGNSDHLPVTARLSFHSRDGDR